ncbi:MAG: hypothetical protein A4E57_00750 [Syntrophorhabdaceae bacterium PtaU1.Bin034]|nr:MAG: hypothetical protein A4E57_00750 [Syntrophorhabdaceae bacterium PtaU1.Bin034]
MRWLFFSYSLPAEPSKARVYVWRRIKKLGAINYQSFWVLPYSNQHVAELRKLVDDIKNYKGESVLIEGKALDKHQEDLIAKAFQESRDEEYGELIAKCEDFFKEIAFEIERQNFIFAEVEENEEELEKLKEWLKKIEKRDQGRASLRKTAIEKIKECEERFDEFAKMVFLRSQGKAKGEVNTGKDNGVE